MPAVGPAPQVAHVVAVGLPGCCRMIPVHPAGAPAHCPEPIAWAGTIQVGREVWRAAACDGHRHGLDGGHPLSEKDRAYFAGLQRQQQRALAGRRWARPAPIDRLG